MFKKRQKLTVTEVGAGVNFPHDLSFVRAVDAAILIIQKVLRQSLIWEKRLKSLSHTATSTLKKKSHVLYRIGSKTLSRQGPLN